MVNGENLQTVNCELVWNEISNYLEGDVSPAFRATMEEHFKTCRRCVSVLEGTRNAIRLYSDERMMEAPAGFGKRLERKLARNVAGKNRWLTWEAWLVPVAALALIVGGLRLADYRSRDRVVRSEQAQAGKNIPQNLVVVVAQGAKVFHVPNCSLIQGKDNLRTLTAKQALKEGFVPCPRCLRKYLEVTTADRSNPAAQADANLDADEQDAHDNDVNANREWR